MGEKGDGSGYLWLTYAALFGLALITAIGAGLTDRSRTPSISVVIDDEPALRFVYGLYVGALTVSRTGLVSGSGFYELPGYGEFWNWWLPRIAFVCGSLQLVSFSLVGMFSVVLDPGYHYAAALGTVGFGFWCELILWVRRREASVLGISPKLRDAGGWKLAANLLVWAGTYVPLVVFAILTYRDTYVELKTSAAIAEWIGYYLVAYINLFRVYDVDIHGKQTKAKEEAAMLEGVAQAIKATSGFPAPPSNGLARRHRYDYDDYRNYYS